MKLNKKQWIIIAAALAAVIIAIVAVVAIPGRKDEDKEKPGKNAALDMTPVTYVRNIAQGNGEREGKAVVAGNFYWVDWTERQNVVRGSYDEAAGTMKNWNEDIPLCDAGLAGLKDYADGYEWQIWRDDIYTYNWEYYCEFNRADKTYVLSTETDHDGYGFYYHEAEGSQYMVQLMGTSTANADGGIYCFKNGQCYGYEASSFQYERRTQDGKNMLVLLDEDGNAMEGAISLEDRGDALHVASVKQSLKKVDEQFYMQESDEGPLYIFLIDDHQLIVGGGASMGVRDDIELCYEPGKRLEVVQQGQVLGCRVEGDVLIANVSGFYGRNEYRLVRQGVNPDKIDPAALFVAPNYCEVCESWGVTVKQIETDEGMLWVCESCESWLSDDDTW